MSRALSWSGPEISVGPCWCLVINPTVGRAMCSSQASPTGFFPTPRRFRSYWPDLLAGADHIRWIDVLVVSILLEVREKVSKCQRPLLIPHGARMSGVLGK